MPYFEAKNAPISISAGALPQIALQGGGEQSS